MTKKNTEALMMLLDKGADPNRQTHTGQTAVWLAAVRGDLSLLRHLAESPTIRWDLKDENGTTNHKQTTHFVCLVLCVCWVFSV